MVVYLYLCVFRNSVKFDHHITVRKKKYHKEK